jgi:hypothetical protein
MSNPERRPPVQAMPGWTPVAVSQLDSRTARAVETLERRAPLNIKKASRAGVDITYLGIAPLSGEPIAYLGELTDWVVSPVPTETDTIVPAAERERMVRLVQAGVTFPRVYVAHEVPKGWLPVVPGPQGEGNASGTVATRNRPVTLDRATAAAATVLVPPTPESLALAERLGGASQRVLTILRTAAPIVAGIAVAPVVLAAGAVALTGAALMALLAGLDPIVFGVIPASKNRPRVGDPAAWYMIAQWNWPEARSD